MSNQILDIKSIVERKKREEEQLLKQQEIEQERIAQSLSRISKIKDTFRNFVNEEVPEIYDFYELDEDSVIIRVFDYRPSQEQEGVPELAMDLHGGSSLDRFYRTFSVAKILNAGEKTPYKKGDIVRLSDWSSSTIDNPKYEMWTTNPYNSSNLDKVGGEPPKHINNLMAVYGKQMFVDNPLKPFLGIDDYVTLCVSTASIVCKIKNAERLVDLI